MPSGKGPLRIAIEDFMETSPVGRWILDHYNLLITRHATAVELSKKAAQVQGASLNLLAFAPRRISAILYTITGEDHWLDGLRKEAQNPLIDQVIGDWADFWRTNLGNAERAKQFEVLGAFFAEPVLGAISGLARQAGEDPDGYMRRVFGILTSIVLAPSIAATAAEVASLGQIETVMAALQSVTASLGLGSVGGIVTSAFMQSGTLPELQRSLKQRFRPTRFTVSEMRDLFALGEISIDQMITEARQDGWREDDIAKWIRLAFKKIGEGDVWALYKIGKIDKDESMRRLRAMGYDPDDIPLLFQINQREDLQDALTLGFRTVREGYREHVYSKAEFTAAMKQMGYTDADVALLIALEDVLAQKKQKALTVSQVKSGWEDNLLSDPEAAKYLRDQGFGEPEIALILAEWKQEIQPKFVKLNKGTITGAYVAGVITRNAAEAKLEAVGLAPDDARLELDLAEARNPEAFQAPQPAPHRQLTLSTVTALFQIGIISADQMQARLVEANYAPADAALLVQAAEAAPPPQVKVLTQSQVEQAYLAGVFDRTTALNHLTGLGFTSDDADTILATVEASNPAVFAPETLQSIRQPSVAVIVEAYRDGILEENEYYARMQEIGYTIQTAQLYAVIATKQERKKVKTLTPSQIGDAYEKGFIERGEALQRLEDQGYNEIDATLLLRLYKSGIEDTQAWASGLNGDITPETMIEQLLSQGFTMDEINAAVSSL
jgi:hypothetical protein